MILRRIPGARVVQLAADAAPISASREAALRCGVTFKIGGGRRHLATAHHEARRQRRLVVGCEDTSQNPSRLALPSRH